MTNNRLEFLPRAKRDLKRISNYSRKKFGEVAVLRTRADINATVEHLRLHPSMGRSREELGSGFRSMVSGEFTVFYRVDSELVSILSIKHQRQHVTEEDFD